MAKILVSKGIVIFAAVFGWRFWSSVRDIRAPLAASSPPWLTKPLSLDYSRTMKEKSHRVSRRCYRSGVDALRGTQTRRLDGHTLYSASHIQIRAERQAA